MNVSYGVPFATIVFVVFILSCSKSTDVLDPVSDHWEYEHPNWQEQGYTECAGVIQSPINIKPDSAVKTNLPNLVFSYHPFPMKLVDNGHTIQVNNNCVNSIIYNRKAYQFMQFHFHCHSEHLINGVANDMELHLVHQQPETGVLLVIGYLIKVGNANPLFESVLTNWPTQKRTEVTTQQTIDLSNIISSNPKYFTYVGSLTTPPCSQGVTFFIMEDYMELSMDQLTRFKLHYSNNARPVQPLNSRLVYENIQ